MASSGGSNAADAPSQPWKARLFGSATIAGPEHNGPAHGVLVVFQGGPPSTREALVRRAKEEGLIRDEPGDVVVARWQPRLDRFDIVTKNTRFEFEDEEPCFVLEPRGEGLCASTYRLRPAADGACVCGGTPARAQASDSASGAKRPREEDDEEGRSAGEPEEEIAAGGSALEQLPDGVILRVLELVGIVGACRMRAVSRRLRAVAAGRASPPREALLDLMEFRHPHHVLESIARELDSEELSPEVHHLLSAASLRVRTHDPCGGSDAYDYDDDETPVEETSGWSSLVRILGHRARFGPGLESVDVSLSVKPWGALVLSYTELVNALREAGGSLEVLRVDIPGRCCFLEAGHGEHPPGLFSPFAKLRVLELRALFVTRRILEDIVASLPSLKAFELSPPDASTLSALAPLALEGLILAGSIKESSCRGLESIRNAPGASSSLRTLSFRRWPQDINDNDAIFPFCAYDDSFNLPAAAELRASTVRAIAALPNIERVEGYFQITEGSRDDVASLGQMRKLASAIKVLVQLDSDASFVLLGLADAARANPSLRIDLFLVTSSSLRGGHTKASAAAVADLVAAAPDALRHVTVLAQGPLPFRLPAALARLGPKTRSLRIAHGVSSLRDLQPYCAFQGMARPSPAFAFSVLVAAPHHRTTLLEMAPTDLALHLPPFASRSFSHRNFLYLHWGRTPFPFPHLGVFGCPP
eukprot:tig00000459_g1068.t1